jgi:hypothetical protein
MYIIKIHQPSIMSSTECQICASTFSNKIRKPIECIFCNKCCCKACFAAYIKEQSVPKCMFCSAELTMDFVEENTTLAFQSEYIKFLDNLKFDVEKSKLPATQRLAELTRLSDKYDCDYTSKWREVNILKDQRRIIKMEYNKLKKNKKFKKVKGVELSVEEKIQLETEKAVIEELKTKLYESKQIIKENKEEAFNIFHLRVLNYTEKRQQRDILAGRIQAPVDDIEEKQVYSRPCISDDCRGFLSKSYKCGTCEKQYCAECHEEKASRNDSDHVCNEEAKATIAMIRRDTKPCPKCSIPIEKVSGCSQMWCVSCHTTFDWNTMRIETGYIHNPEYLRWMRENNREIARNPYDIQGGGCNDMPSWYRVNQQLSALGVYSSEWDEIHRRYGHIRDSSIPNLPTENENDFIDLRVSYLNSEISNEIWRKKLGMKLKVNRISHERRNVLDMYINALKDLFLNLIQDSDIVQFKNCAYELEKYTDIQLNKINKKYKSKNTTYASIKKV